MAKIRDSVSENGRNTPDVENINAGGNDGDESLDVFYYVKRSREKRNKGSALQTTDLSANIGGDLIPSNNTNTRRRKAESIVRMIFAAVVVLAILTATVVTVRILVFSDKGSIDPLSDLTADEDTTETSMVIIEVTERSLTSIEISAAIEKDDLALARASAAFGGKQELSVQHGTRKLKLQDVR